MEQASAWHCCMVPQVATLATLVGSNFAFQCKTLQAETENHRSRRQGEAKTTNRLFRTTKTTIKPTNHKVPTDWDPGPLRDETLRRNHHHAVCDPLVGANGFGTWPASSERLWARRAAPDEFTHRHLRCSEKVFEDLQPFPSCISSGTLSLEVPLLPLAPEACGPLLGRRKELVFCALFMFFPFLPQLRGVGEACGRETLAALRTDAFEVLIIVGSNATNSRS